MTFLQPFLYFYIPLRVKGKRQDGGGGPSMPVAFWRLAAASDPVVFWLVFLKEWSLGGWVPKAPGRVR